MMTKVNTTRFWQYVLTQCSFCFLLSKASCEPPWDQPTANKCYTISPENVNWFKADESKQKLEAKNAYPVADQLTQSARSGNPNATISFHAGDEHSFIPKDPHSQYTSGKTNELPKAPSSKKVITFSTSSRVYIIFIIHRFKIFVLIFVS